VTEPKEFELPVDFAIITVIQEERDAVIELFSLSELESQSRTLHHGKITSTANGEEHTILLARCRSRGNNSANSLASELIREFQPTNLIVVGIAGGVSGRDDLALGDVVTHDDLHYYELIKQSGGTEQQREMVVETASPSLLDTAEKVVLRNDWWQALTIGRPADLESKPKVVTGQILSGDKLLGDPESEQLINLLKQFDKALAVEMESGGVGRAVYEMRPIWRSEFLIIRGVSDFCNVEGNQATRDAWKVYASQTAAALALALVRATAARPRVSSELDAYRRVLQNAVETELTSIGSNDFNLTFSRSDHPAKPVKNLADVVQEKKRVLLRGYAGGGKSILVRKCAKYLLQKDIIPIVIDLKAWTEDYSEELEKLIANGEDLDRKFELVLRACITDLNQGMISSFPEFPCVLMVDGLNEVFGRESTKYIVDILDEYVRINAPLASVLVTDRIAQRDLSATKWLTVDLDLVDTAEVEREIKTRFGPEALNELGEQDRKLLRIPYYLNIALKSESPELGSAAKAIESYFLNQVRLNDDELRLLSSTAFEILKKEKSSSFEARSFSDRVGHEIQSKLEEAGAIRVTADGKVQFEHQLHQDYLFSRHLASHTSEWNTASFDAVSFDSQSVEALEMVLEQLSTEILGDKFLTALYDWNWGTTVSCLANVAQTGSVNYSPEMESVILSVVAEKRFDRILKTRERANELLSLFPSEIAKEFKEAEGINEVIDLAGRVTSDKAWFSQWRLLFSRTTDGPITEAELKLVASSDSVSGWTAANVIRRFHLTAENLSYLRGIYASAKISAGDNSIAWRVVHALGKSDSEETVDLLFDALATDFKWVRYGAARSLIEVAAITQSESLRTEIISRMKLLVDSLDSEVLKEISRAAFYKGPPTDWLDIVVPLLEAIRDKNHRVEADRSIFESAVQRLKTDQTKWS